MKKIIQCIEVQLTLCFLLNYTEFVINAKADEKIHKAFIDPTGSHVIISMTNGDNYYTNTQANKNPKLMPKLKVNLLLFIWLTSL